MSNIYDDAYNDVSGDRRELVKMFCVYLRLVIKFSQFHISTWVDNRKHLHRLLTTVICATHPLFPTVCLPHSLKMTPAPIFA